MRRALATGALVLAVAGCSLPLPQDVKTVGEVKGGRQVEGDLQVIPPGPKLEQPVEEIVTGFLGAQANSDDRHAIAREFLAPEVRDAWDDTAEVRVYLPEGLEVELDEQDAATASVLVTATVSADVASDGSYHSVARKVTERYGLRKTADGWRLATVPAGLSLTAADLRRAFIPRDLYYLDPGASESPHVVPDRVFLPESPDLAKTLVSRLIEPPSQALDGSVRTGFPSGSRVTLRSIETSRAGVVTVDLGGLKDLTGKERQDLSARLVWTLRGLGPGFNGLRLLLDGKAVAVPGAAGVQDAGAWESYDPQGFGVDPAYYFVADRRLRASLTLPANNATAGEASDPDAVVVDDVAVSPDRTLVALLAGKAPGPVAVQIGPPRGPAYPKVLTATGLSSPSWGSGAYGLWLLRNGRDVVRVVPGSSRLRPVSFVDQPAGRLSGLAISRDASRAAVVAGGSLLVAQVRLAEGVPELFDARTVLTQLREVTDVVWATPTELVVIGSVNGGGRRVLRLAVDGSLLEVLNTGNLTATHVAAAGDLLVLEAEGVLHSLTARGFVRNQNGRSPAFPG